MKYILISRDTSCTLGRCRRDMGHCAQCVYLPIGFAERFPPFVLLVAKTCR